VENEKFQDLVINHLATLTQEITEIKSSQIKTEKRLDSLEQDVGSLKQDVGSLKKPFQDWKTNWFLKFPLFLTATSSILTSLIVSRPRSAPMRNLFLKE